MSEDALLVDRAAGIARLTLNRPDAGNAFDQPLAGMFRDVIGELVDDAATRVIVIDAAGKLFCAGGDVAAMIEADDPTEYVVQLGSTLAEAMLSLSRARPVIVAAVQGAAAGAGLGLVLNADVVASGPRASYLSAYAGVGFVPDAGVSRRLPEIVGPRRALDLTLTGRVLTAAEALDWGLVTELVAEDAGLKPRVDELAAALVRGPAHAFAATKQLVASRGTDYATHLADEVAGLREVMGSEDTRTRLAAFVARRAKP